MKPLKGQVIPRQYVMQGESLDTMGDVLFARRMLHMTRGMRKMPDVSKSTVMGREYIGKLQDHSGMLPTQVTVKKAQGKRAARPYGAFAARVFKK